MRVTARSARARPAGRHDDVRAAGRVSGPARSSTLRPPVAAPARTCGVRRGASSVARRAAEAWWHDGVVPSWHGWEELCGDSTGEAVATDGPDGAGAVAMAPGAAVCMASAANARSARSSVHGTARRSVSQAPFTTRSYEGNAGRVQNHAVVNGGEPSGRPGRCGVARPRRPAPTDTGQCTGAPCD